MLVIEKQTADSSSKDTRESSVGYNTWLFHEEAFLKSSPSRKQMTVVQELKTRESLHSFVVRLGSALKLDGKTILAATVYLNRFYMRLPMTTSKYYVASAAIAISSKLNDTYRQPDKIALVACTIRNPDQAIDEHSSIFWSWRDQLLYREELILKNLNFDLNVDLPYDLRDLIQRQTLPPQTDNGYYLKQADILKNSVSLLEMISSLPLLVAYNISTLFGTMLILNVSEAKARFSRDQKSVFYLPQTILYDILHVDVDLCYKCYLYLLKLLKYCDDKDPRLASHKNVSKAIKHITREAFYELVSK